MIEFIFMLTRDDVTLPDAREVYASIKGSGVSGGCLFTASTVMPMGRTRLATARPISP